MKPLKRLEHYITAIFTLGRIKVLAKDAHQKSANTFPRVEALETRAGQGEDRAQHIADQLQQTRDWAGVAEERLTHAHARSDVVDRNLGAMQATFNDHSRHLSAIDDRHRDLAGKVGDVDARYGILSDHLRRNAVLADEMVAAHRREADFLKRTGQSDAALLARMFTDLSRRMDQNGAPPPTAKAPAADLPNTEGFDLFIDSFYHRLENQWRGAPEEIARRLKVYLPDIEAAWLRTDQKPVMDLGCGRGEWLGLLRDHDITGFGIDTNTVQLADAQAAGLDARAGDALAALAAQPDNSLSALTAHHLIEHLPFDAVAWITREAMRVLAPGGILMFETPNTRNVLVGATTFHTDPTHLKPMPEQVMGVLLETAGFDPIDLRGLNPHERLGEFLDRPGFDDELAMLMFGPQDLAILGRKPIEAS